MQRLPKFPKGLKARIAKAQRVADRKKQIAARKKEIAAMKKKLETLRRQGS